jgi:hypothetical protein
MWVEELAKLSPIDCVNPELLYIPLQLTPALHSRPTGIKLVKDVQLSNIDSRLLGCEG